MKRFTSALKRMCFITLCILMTGKVANATLYTAVVSGNFSSGLTWGGAAPGSLLSSGDVVIIPLGINVTMTGNESFSGTSTLTVLGALTAAPGTVLSITSGGLAGAGTVSADSMVLGLMSGFTFTGNLVANKMTSVGANLASAAIVTVRKSLNLSSGVLNLGAGNLIMGNLSTVNEMGGTLTTSGSGLLTLDSTYNVIYSLSSVTSGIELTGTGLDSVTVNVPGSVTLGNNPTINGALTLTSGVLTLGAHTLTFGSTGDFLSSGTGTISGSTLSNIVVNATAGLTGALRVTGGANTLGSLLVNTGSGTTTSLGSDLNINTLLTLTSGAMALNGHTLTLNTTGNIAALGTGTITGSSTSNLVVNTIGGLTGAIPFTTGSSMLNNLTLNTTTGGSSLGSDLSLNGMLTLTSGVLSLNGHTLTLTSTGNVAGTGTGTLTGSAASNLVVNTTGGLTGSIPFTTGGNLLNNLTLNTGTGGASIGSDLGLNGMLTLTSGTLTLNGHTLTLNPTADVSGTGIGTITGSTLSNLTINSATGLTGALRFASGTGGVLNNLIVNAGTGAATLGSDLNINNLLTLTTGALSLNGHTLTINPTGNLSAIGTGTITGSTTSNLVVNTIGGLATPIAFTSGGNMLNNLTLATGTGGLTLVSDLGLSGMLTLTSGALTINGHTLTLNATGNIAGSGTGTITGSSVSNLVINTTVGLTGAIPFTTGSNLLNNLTLNTGTGGASIGSDLGLSGMLTLTSGALSLNGHTLTLNPTGNLAVGGTGTITGSTLSNVIVNATAGLSGILRFTPGTGSVLNNLTLNTVTGGTTLGSDLSINNMLTLTNGALALNGNTLTLNATGNIAGVGTGTITGSLTSSLIVNTTGGLTGAVPFTTGSSLLNNLTLNTTTGGMTLGSDLNLSGMLTLSTGTLSINGHTLTLNTTGNVAGTGTGTLTGSTASNLIVNATSGLTGALRFGAGSGSVLNNLTLNSTTGGATLGSNLSINNMLTLTSGALALNGNTLTLNATGNLAGAGTGTITGSFTSNLIVNTTGGLTGSLPFTTGSSTLNNLTLNTTIGGASLGSDLGLSGMLTLTSGALTLNGHTLTLNSTGNIAGTGTGTITGSSTSSLVVNTTGGLTGTVPFTTGSSLLNNLTLNTTTGGMTLGSDLGLSGMLTLSTGTLSINGHTLTLNATGNVAGTGTGTLTGSTASNLIVNATSGLTGALRFAAGSGSVLNNLTLNSTTGGATLGSNLSINNMLTLTSGALALNGNTLTLNATGNLAGTGVGTITGSTTSNLVINTTGGLTGSLPFTSGSSLLNNLTLNTTTGGASLGSNLDLSGMLTLTSGALTLNGHTLSLNGASDIATTGTGTITGSALSNLVVNSTAGLTGSIPFTIGSSLLDSLTINSSTGGASLASDLGLNGMLTLTSGTLMLNGHTLTLNSTGDVSASGTGTITGGTASNLIVNVTAGLTGAVRFATGTGGMLNDLTVNTTGGGIAIGSDLSINHMLTLSNGILAINGHTLTLNATGNIAGSGTGTITGGPTSSLVVNTTGGLTNPIPFTTGSSLLNNFTLSTGTGGAALGSDLGVSGVLTLSSGTLTLNGHTLTLNVPADISASGTGTLTGSTTSSLIVNTVASPSGLLRFATGGNMLNNLTVNMGATSDNLTLGSNLTVNGMLNLQSGKVKLGSNNLSLAAGSTVNGGSSASYVMTDGTGSLVMNLAAGASDSFKVGTTTNFAPMAIGANSGATTGDVSINVADGVSTDGTAGTTLSTTAPVVNATWFVSSTASAVNYNMTAVWNAGMEVNGFDRTNAFISHYTGGAWDAQTPGVATTIGSMYAISRTGITSLSPFMVSGTPSHVAAPVVTVANANISIYPNPVADVLNYTTTAAISNVEILNAGGQVVKTTNGAQSSVSVSDLAAGTYFIHFHGTDLNTVQKFIKD